MTEADAPALHNFMVDVLANDLALGGGTAATAEHLALQVRNGLQTWLAIESGAIVGVLGPQISGMRATETEERSYHYYGRGIVHYTKTAIQALRIIRDLALFAVTDTRNQGKLPDDIVIEGATACQGATWCRHIGAEETVLDAISSRFIIPVLLLEERFKAVK
jgi:hypothetical protein